MGEMVAVEGEEVKEARNYYSKNQLEEEEEVVVEGEVVDFQKNLEMINLWEVEVEVGDFLQAEKKNLKQFIEEVAVAKYD